YCKGDMDIEIVQCWNCGYVYNKLFDNEKMKQAYFDGEYITPKVISEVMSANIIFLKNKIKKYAGDDKVFLEIAPGACDLLLALLKDFKFAYSVDPSFTPDLLLSNYENISHIRNFFSYQVVKEKINHKINFVILRHLIEHIHNPREFLEDVVKLLEDNGVIYIETPNLLNIINSKRFYEIRHEHCAYYQENTLINIMLLLGCSLIETLYLYDGQWIGLFFRKNIENRKKRDITYIDYKEGYKFISEIQYLEKILKKYQKIIIYGAGGHANSMMSYLSEDNCKKIIRAIDADERRWGTYLQKSSIKIVEPSIENIKDAECILMIMPIYEKKVIEKEVEKFMKDGRLNLDVICTSDTIQIKKLV
ncbi:class I SAM-dependent methyltransferase, partial [Campylobacter jejuni]|nr:class I SAM-dependent methyltransferase [Campylobacter jejuni]